MAVVNAGVRVQPSRGHFGRVVTPARSLRTGGGRVNKGGSNSRITAAGPLLYEATARCCGGCLGWRGVASGSGPHSGPDFHKLSRPMLLTPCQVKPGSVKPSSWGRRRCVAWYLVGRGMGLRTRVAPFGRKEGRSVGAIAVALAAVGLCLTDRLLGDRGAAISIFLQSA